MGYPFVERLDGRAGQYRKQKLIAQFGPDIPLPDLRYDVFATGLGALGLLGWRRKRKNAAAIAA